jgi:hypothetical protein
MSLAAFNPNDSLGDGNGQGQEGEEHDLLGRGRGSSAGAKRPLQAQGAPSGLRTSADGGTGGEGADDDDGEVKLKTSADAEATLGLKVPKKRRTFNEAVLTNRDGLLRIYQDFPTACPFRGRGHEAADAKKLMARYREWAFQLYPGLAFPDMLARCEVLGTKAQVRACVYACVCVPLSSSH